MASSEFEGMSLAELHALVADADPDKLTSAGSAVGDASPKIDAIGLGLRGYAERVEWEGEGAEGFRDWTREFAGEVMKLAEYAAVVGDQMAAAGQALREAQKAIPKPVDAAEAHGDPDLDDALQKDATTNKQAAIHQLERVTSYYRFANDEIKAREEPRFKPLPIDDRIRTQASQAYGSSPGAEAYATTSNTRTQADGSSAPEPRTRVAQETGQDTRTAIDGVKSVTPPDAAERRVGDSPPTTVSPETRREATLPPAPVRPGPSTPTVRPPSPSIGPPARSVGPSGEKPLTSTSTPRGPVLPRAGNNEGIVGGKQRPLTSGPRLPRSTVIGEERTSMPRGPVVGGGPPNTRGGQSITGNSMPERRLSSESGGRVNPPRAPFVPEGGRHGNPAAHRQGPERRSVLESGGSVAAPRHSNRERSEFTPGGAGLVRGSQAGVPGPSSRTSAVRANHETGDAPDYLVEDEETWTLGRRDTVPPVVD
ncbi:conserved hypothetical protein [Streptomyces himastatinicus ATCC 53653]|uniref:Uncharacterized protein n=1 Tax=Streptomyces himastatinicus ATCC 53653 TaxID=457427 RepID=D9WB62_9ACTN|nr:conserved hypothetical protein [Streptomyces himastatinicus ATCC 53653]